MKPWQQSTPDLAGRLALGVSLAWLWWQLINHLRIEWTVNAQYAYGWAVPVLGLYLLGKNAKSALPPINEAGAAAKSFQVSGFRFQVLLLFAALLYLPTRLIQEANPDWRLVSWALALEVITITICLFQNFRISEFPRGNFATMVFPLAFFLIAVPWPTRFETTVIQSLTRANAGITIELLNAFGIPALQRGSIIEISTGLVGIDDACSGIRSVQATLMIALFLGALYQLSVPRRLLLVVSGFALAFVFNIARTLLLVTVAVKQGVPAISRWHDPAGVTILVGCFLGLWWLGIWMAKGQNGKQKAETGAGRRDGETTRPRTETGEKQKSEINQPKPAPPPCSACQHVSITAFQNGGMSASQRFRVSVFAFTAWLLVVEVSTEAWYRAHERKLPAAVEWHPVVATTETELKELPISENAQRILRYDAGRNVAWTKPDGSRWQMIFLSWNGGRIAAHLARNHTPEVCLSAAGHELQSVSEVKLLTVSGLTLPFRLYTFQNDGTPLFVFYCLQEDRAPADGFATESLTFDSRLAAVRAGRRNLGQRSLEVAIWGQADAAAAENALQHELEKLITVKN